MREPDSPTLTDEDFDGLLNGNGGRVRRGIGGQEFVVMPLPNFRRVINTLADHGADTTQLMGAIVRQAGGVIEVDTTHIRDPETHLVIEEIGDDDDVTTLRVRDMSH